MNEVQATAVTRKARADEINALKALADKERDAFGFITRGTLLVASLNGEVMVVAMDGEVVGFQHYHHRKRDDQTTLYHKVVAEAWRGRGLATMLVSSVCEEARSLGKRRLLLKCPVDLPANGFHIKYGFKLLRQEVGRRRLLNVWVYDL